MSLLMAVWCGLFGHRWYYGYIVDGDHSNRLDPSNRLHWSRLTLVSARLRFVQQECVRCGTVYS